MAKKISDFFLNNDLIIFGSLFLMFLLFGSKELILFLAMTKKKISEFFK